MADFTTYITKEGDRWDTIAYLAYGDPSRMNQIIEANPQVSITTRLTSNLTLKIPILDAEQETIDTNLLPPWKRD